MPIGPVLIPYRAAIGSGILRMANLTPSPAPAWFEPMGHLLLGLQLLQKSPKHNQRHRWVRISLAHSWQLGNHAMSKLACETLLGLLTWPSNPPLLGGRFVFCLPLQCAGKRRSVRHAGKGGGPGFIKSRGRGGALRGRVRVRTGGSLSTFGGLVMPTKTTPTPFNLLNLFSFAAGKVLASPESTEVSFPEARQRGMKYQPFLKHYTQEIVYSNL